MSQERLKILKTQKFEFETYEKSLDPTTSSSFHNLKLFFSLLVSSSTRSQDLSKISQKLSHLRKKTLNPKLQPAFFSLVHIKLQ